MPVIRSRYEDVYVPKGSTVADFVFEQTDRHGEDVAIVDGISGRSYTFAQIRHLSRKIASALTRQGYTKGDVFTVLSPNLPEYLPLIFGISRMGGVLSAINPSYTEDELVKLIGIVEAKVIITVPPLVGRIFGVKKRLSHVKDVFVFGEAQGCLPIRSLLADDGSAFPDVNVLPSDIFALLFSSGTTGFPKAVMISHEVTTWHMAQMDSKDFTDVKAGESATAILPFFHVYGLLVGLRCLRNGFRQVSLQRFEPEPFLRILQDYKINHLYVVPPTVLFLAQHPLVDNYDVSSARQIFCAGAPLAPEIAEEAMRRLYNVTSVRQGYGSTETLPTHLPSLELANEKQCNVGRLVPNTEAKIIDTDTGEILGVNGVGEICVRGPQISPGYFKHPEATANSMDSDGFFHTGDVGYYDEREVFFIVDRLKELIKYKGFQVAPADLETTLLTHPSITDVAVIGVHDDRAGEVPKAFVVRTNQELTEDDVKEFVAGKVAPFKRLRGGVEFVESIPKSPSGKILRKNLRKRVKSKL